MIRDLTKTLALATAALVAGPACASMDDGARGPAISVEVHNNFPGASTQEISIYAEGTSPRRLGTITAGDTKTFEARAIDLGERHRLLADALSGGVMRSPVILVEAGDRVVWDLSTNRVYIEN